MGFTSILALLLIALFLVVCNIVAKGVKSKNWKQVIVAIAAFTVFVGILGYGLICFITSM
jgi:hypothetical protein